MNDESAALTVSFDQSDADSPASESSLHARNSIAATIPDYLQDTYWWAYLHPSAVRFWERSWLVNTILWGQMNRLTELVVRELDLPGSADLLQIACVYGDFSGRLSRHAAGNGSRLHVLDIARIQLANARRKLAGCGNVRYHLQDSSQLNFPDSSFEHSVLYFLLHEQPEDVRRRTLSEALRVTRPGGKVVIVDYHRPRWWNGLRAVMWPILRSLEPFALDLWRRPIASWLPVDNLDIATDLYFGGLYQKTTIRRKS